VQLLLLPPESTASLGPHRTRAGWEICEDGPRLWLRIPDGAESQTASLPALARYRIDSRQRLIPLNATLPVGLSPAGPWQPLTEFLSVPPPAPLLPGRTPGRVDISLSRSSHEVEPAALLANVDDLLAWANQASRLRLSRLTFAASSDGRVLVRGTPLPPVPGSAHYFQGRLALPCGWELTAPLLPVWVEESLALPTGAIALLLPEGGIEMLGQESFTPLSLAALRRTHEALSPV
jgi:hypothetical protein